MFFRRKDTHRIVQDSIDRSFEKADIIWRQCAVEVVEMLARKRQYFTSEDVIETLEKMNVYTRNLCALGGVMQGARRRGLIKQAGYRQSQRRSRHKAPIRVWESLIK